MEVRWNTLGGAGQAQTVGRWPADSTGVDTPYWFRRASLNWYGLGYSDYTLIELKHRDADPDGAQNFGLYYRFNYDNPPEVGFKYAYGAVQDGAVYPRTNQIFEFNWVVQESGNNLPTYS